MFKIGPPKSAGL